MKPKVDIVIATIGRKALEQAVMAACSQSYNNYRVVVIGDGPCPDAKSTVAWLKKRYKKNLIYRETKKRLGGYGDYVKRWWIDNKEASEYIRFLDDDDWIPPNAIADMMRLWTPDTTVILCGMVVCLGSAQHTERGTGYYRIQRPALEEHCAASGMALLKTSAARNTNFPAKEHADTSMAIACARQGEAHIIDMPLYWYNAHQGGKVNSVDAKAGLRYNTKWVFKPPRSFRMSLFNRVPLCNYYRNNKPLLVYDQALFRPMAELTRKKAWIREKTYYYDMPHPANKTVDINKIKQDAAFVVSRGYLGTGALPERKPQQPHTPLCTFIVPAYKATKTIKRTIESIQKQKGAFQCIVTVDGYDVETEKAAKDAIESDERFSVILRKKRLYALGNILATLQDIACDKVVCFVDADDYLMVDDLVLTLERLYADDDVEIVCGSNHAMFIPNKSIAVDRYNPYTVQLDDINKQIMKTCGTIARQKLTHDAGQVIHNVITGLESRNNSGRIGRFIAKLISLREQLLNESSLIGQSRTLANIIKTIKRIT